MELFKSISITVFSIVPITSFIKAWNIVRNYQNDFSAWNLYKRSLKKLTKVETEDGTEQSEEEKEEGKKYENKESNHNDGNLCGWRTITFVKTSRKITNFKSVYCRL